MDVVALIRRLSHYNQLHNTNHIQISWDKTLDTE